MARPMALSSFYKNKRDVFTGWLGYTLAWTWRTFPQINNGQPFPPTYDRRNDLDLVGTYHLNDRWTFGATFTYGTGQAYTQINALAPDAGKRNPRDSYRWQHECAALAAL